MCVNFYPKDSSKYERDSYVSFGTNVGDPTIICSDRVEAKMNVTEPNVP